MATRVTNLQTWDLNLVDIGDAAKVKGGALATATSRNRALRSQMQILPHGRRVVAQVGLHGSLGFFVVDGIDPETNSREYPEPDWDRTLYRGKVNITPGYELWVSMVAVPSGPCQHYPGGGAPYVVGGDSAKLIINCEYNNGVLPVPLIFELVASWSQLQYKALDPADGGAFSLERKEVKIPMPDVTPGWVEHVTAEISIVAIGGLRPVEIILYEKPKSAVTHDESHRECTIPMLPLQGGMPDTAITGKVYPTDARLGSHQASKSTRDYRKVCGPFIFSWSCWDDPTVTLADNAEGDPATVTNTSFEDLKYGGISSYAVNNPGWSISSGTARNLEQSGPLELRGVNGVIPVLVRAYAKVSSGTGTIRFQTAFYSLRDLTTTSTSYVWLEGLAWFRCGVHQTQASLLEVLGKCSGGGTLSVRYLSCEHYGNYVVTE